TRPSRLRPSTSSGEASTIFWFSSAARGQSASRAATMAWSARARARRLASLVGGTDLPPAHEGTPGWALWDVRIVAVEGSSLRAPLRVSLRAQGPLPLGPFPPGPFLCPFESLPSTLSPDAVPVGDTAPQGHRAERQR